MYSHVIRISLVCTYISYLCQSYVIRMSLVCPRMSFFCHPYVLARHPYVTCMYSYVTRMSLVLTGMPFVFPSYVLVCHPYVICMYWYIIRMSLVCGFVQHGFIKVCIFRFFCETSFLFFCAFLRCVEQNLRKPS